MHAGLVALQLYLDANIDSNQCGPCDPSPCTHAYELMCQAIPAPYAQHVPIEGRLSCNFGMVTKQALLPSPCQSSNMYSRQVWPHPIPPPSHPQTICPTPPSLAKLFWKFVRAIASPPMRPCCSPFPKCIRDLTNHLFM